MEPRYAERLQGRFTGVLQWSDLEALWAAMRTDAAGWYLVEAGQPLPAQPLAPDELPAQVDRLDNLLRQAHRHTYCGVVYADDLHAPTLVKVFDPRTLGSMCSCSSEPTPPAWVFSRWRPEASPNPQASPSRAAWWRPRWRRGAA